MQILLRSILLLAIALSISLPSAFSMIRIGGIKPSEEQGSTSQQKTTFDRTAAARRKSEGTDKIEIWPSDSNAKRGTAVAARDETYEKAAGEESWPIKVPLGFSEIEREWLKQDLQKISPERLCQYNNASWQPGKPTQEILGRWKAKGVTIDPDFVEEATAIRKDAEKKTIAAKKLETRAEQAFSTLEEKQQYAVAIYHSDQFIEAAAQVRNAWIKTAEMHQQIPGRQWGARLKDTWASKVDEWQQRREEVQQDFLRQIGKIDSEATASIEKFQGIGAALMQAKKYNEGASLSGAYGKIITAQRALPTPLPEEKLSMAAAIKLELGLESIKAAMLQAELKHQVMIGSGGSESDVEERTTNESITTFSTPSQRKLSADEIETERKNYAFQQRAAALECYAAQTLKIVYDCFSIFTSGGEFGDETDTNNLAAAYDRVETADWVLNALKTRAASGEQDSWLQQEKEEMAIANLEQAIEEAHTIAARIGNKQIYEQDRNTARILADLKKAKAEYAEIL